MGIFLFVLLFQFVNASEFIKNYDDYKDDYWLYEAYIVCEIYQIQTSKDWDCPTSFEENSAITYESEDSSFESDDDIKIASLNSLKLGARPYKNLTLMAKMFNQWDLVSVLEIMSPGQSSPTQKLNRRLMTILKNTDDKAVIKKNADLFVMPAYLVLLEELKKLDPSWSLTIGSHPTGNYTNRETIGIYYRSDKVQNIETPLCEYEGKACYVNLETKNDNLHNRFVEYVARGVFASEFKIGDNNITIVPMHTRFGAYRSSFLTDLRRYYFSKQFEDFEDEEDLIQIEDMLNSKFETSRYFEMSIVAGRIAEYIRQRSVDDEHKNIMWLGDFNLPTQYESGDDYAYYWKLLFRSHWGLGGYKIFVDTPTTYGDSGLASSYDHFIYDTDRVDFCDATTAHAYNFIDPEEDESSENYLDYLKNFHSKMNSISSTSELEGYFLEEQPLSVTFFGMTLKDFIERKDEDSNDLFDSDYLQKELNDYYEKFIVNFQAGNYSSLTEVMSDHLPIVINCSGE